MSIRKLSMSQQEFTLWGFAFDASRILFKEN
jgi:hypothetical protein